MKHPMTQHNTKAEGELVCAKRRSWLWTNKLTPIGRPPPGSDCGAGPSHGCSSILPQACSNGHTVGSQARLNKRLLNTQERNSCSSEPVIVWNGFGTSIPTSRRLRVRLCRRVEMHQKERQREVAKCVDVRAAVYSRFVRRPSGRGSRHAAGRAGWSGLPRARLGQLKVEQALDVVRAGPMTGTRHWNGERSVTGRPRASQGVRRRHGAYWALRSVI